MEDLFQILIWLFIIINFVASIKKNKKKRQLENQQPDEQIEDAANNSVNKNKAEYLEFFGMKIPLQKEEEDARFNEEDYSDEENETWNPEEEFDETDTISTLAGTQSEIPASRSTELENDNSEKIRELMKQAEQIEQSEEDDLLSEFERAEKQAKRKKESPYKKLLESKSELKRAIIISEILNKPKALRKNG